MVTRNVTFKALNLLIFLGLALSTAHSFAADKKTNKKRAKSQMVKTEKVGVIKQNLSTDLRFDDLTVRGRRQTPLGLNVVVEAEKDMPSLVDFRNDYKDRAQTSLSGR